MVRVVDPERTNRGAYLSLAAVLIVGLAGFFIWRAWRTESPPATWERTLESKHLEWRCAKGHRFDAPAQIGPRDCIVCGTPAELLDSYRCPQHGVMEVDVRLARDWTPERRSILVRVAGGKFTPGDEPILCPRCKRTLIRQRPDPLRSRAGRN